MWKGRFIERNVIFICRRVTYSCSRSDKFHVAPFLSSSPFLPPFIPRVPARFYGRSLFHLCPDGNFSARAALTRSPGAFSRIAIRKVGVSHAVWKRYLATAITLIDKGARGSLGPRERLRRRRYFSRSHVAFPLAAKSGRIHRGIPRVTVALMQNVVHLCGYLREISRRRDRNRARGRVRGGERRIVTENAFALEKLVFSALARGSPELSAHHSVYALKFSRWRRKSMLPIRR